MSIHAGPSAARLGLIGELDLSHRARLKEALRPLESVDLAVVDVSEATYLDSTVLGCLIGLRKAMALNGKAGIVHIIGASSHVRRLFEVTGLVRIFDVDGNVPQIEFQSNGTFKGSPSPA